MISGFLSRHLVVFTSELNAGKYIARLAWEADALPTELLPHFSSFIFHLKMRLQTLSAVFHLISRHFISFHKRPLVKHRVLFPGFFKNHITEHITRNSGGRYGKAYGGLGEAT